MNIKEPWGFTGGLMYRISNESLKNIKIKQSDI
jgi:hypothetical protein